MGGRQDDEVAWRSRDAARPGPVRRSLALVSGLVLVSAATAGAFLTDDARYLRLAVLAAAWAFLAAVLLAGRHRGDPLPRGEEESRRAQDRDLAHVRDELARLGDLRHGLAALSDVRADLADVRAELAALSAFRADLAELGELRADVGRLRAELADQLDGHMPVERAVMRTGATRMPLDQGPAGRFDGPATSDRLEEPRTAAFSLAPPPPAAQVWNPAGNPAGNPAANPAAQPPPPSSSSLDWLADPAIPDPGELPLRTWSRHEVAEPGRGWPASVEAEPVLARPLWEAAGAAAPDRDRPVLHRRRTDDTGAELLADPADAVTSERHASGAVPPLAFRPSPGPAGVPPGGAALAPEAPADPLHDPLPGEPAGHVRLTEILAANAVIPAGTPRRRHRYRDDDEPDDVLARVLGPRP